MKENSFKLNTFVRRLNNRNLKRNEIENYFRKCSSQEIANSHFLQLKLSSTLIDVIAKKENFELALSNVITFIKRVVKNTLKECRRNESLKTKVWSLLLLLWNKLKLLIEQDSCSTDLSDFTSWLLKNVIDFKPSTRRFDSSGFNISENLFFVDDHFKDLSLDIILGLKSAIQPQSRDSTLIYTVARYILEEHSKPSNCIFKFLKLMMVAKVLHCLSKSERDATLLLQDLLKKMIIPNDFWKWAEENLNLSIPQEMRLKGLKRLRWILSNINVCAVYKIIYGDKYLKGLSKKAENGSSGISGDNFRESMNSSVENESPSYKPSFNEDSKQQNEENANSESLPMKKNKKKRLQSLSLSNGTADTGMKWIVQPLNERKDVTLETEELTRTLNQTNAANKNCNNTTGRKEKRKINETNINKNSNGVLRKQLKRAHSLEIEENRETCSPSMEKQNRKRNIINKPSNNLCHQKEDTLSTQVHPKKLIKTGLSDYLALRSSHEEVDRKRKRKNHKNSKLHVASCSMDITENSLNKKIVSTGNKDEKKVKNRQRRQKNLQNNLDDTEISDKCLKDVAGTEEMAVKELKNKSKTRPSKDLKLRKNEETETSGVSETSVKKMKKTSIGAETYKHCENLETKDKSKKKLKKLKALPNNLGVGNTDLTFEDVKEATSNEEMAGKKSKKNKLKTFPSRDLILKKNNEDKVQDVKEISRFSDDSEKKKKRKFLKTKTNKNCEVVETKRHENQSELSTRAKQGEVLDKDLVKKSSKDKCLPDKEEARTCSIKRSKNIEGGRDASREDSHKKFNDSWIVKKHSLPEMSRNLDAGEVESVNIEKETKESSETKITEKIESKKSKKRKREQKKLTTSLDSLPVLKKKKEKEGSEIREETRTKRKRTHRTKKESLASINNTNKSSHKTLDEIDSGSCLYTKDKAEVSDLEVLEEKEAKYDEHLSKKSNKGSDMDEASGNESDIVDCDEDHTMFTEEETCNYHQFQLKEMKEEKLRKAKSILSQMKDPNEEASIVEEESYVETNSREEIVKITEDITHALYKKRVHSANDTFKRSDESHEEDELPYGSDNDSDLEVIYDTINKDIENCIKKEMASSGEKESIRPATAEADQSSEMFISSVFNLYQSVANKKKEKNRRDSIEVVEHEHLSGSNGSRNEDVHYTSESRTEELTREENENEREVYNVSLDDLNETKTKNGLDNSITIIDEKCRNTKALNEDNDAVEHRNKEETYANKTSSSEVEYISSSLDKSENKLQFECKNSSEKENVAITCSVQQEKTENGELETKSDEWETISVSSSLTDKGSESLKSAMLNRKDQDSENENKSMEEHQKFKEKSEKNASFCQSDGEDEGKRTLSESLLVDDGGSSESNGDEILSYSLRLSDSFDKPECDVDKRQKSTTGSPHRKALCFDDEKDKIIGENIALASDRQVSSDHICLLSGVDVACESIAAGAIYLENRIHENKENIMDNKQKEDLNGSSILAGKDSSATVKEGEQIASIVVKSLRNETKVISPRSPSKISSKRTVERSASKMATLTPLKVANAALESEIIISPHVSDESASQISNTEIENSGIISFIPDDTILSNSCVKEEQEEEEENGFDFLSSTYNASPGTNYVRNTPSKMEQSFNQSNLSTSSKFSPLHLSKLSQNQSKLSELTSSHSPSPSLQTSNTPSSAKRSSRKDKSILTPSKKQSLFISPSKMQHQVQASTSKVSPLHVNESPMQSPSEKSSAHMSEDNAQSPSHSKSKSSSSLILNNSSDSPSYAKPSPKLSSTTRSRVSIEDLQSPLLRKSSRLTTQSPSPSSNRSLPLKRPSTHTIDDDFQSPCTSTSKSSSLIIFNKSPYAKSSQKLANTTRNRGSIESSQSPLIRKSPRSDDNCITKESIESPKNLLYKKSPRLNKNSITRENTESLLSPLIGKSPRLNDNSLVKENSETPQSSLIKKSPILSKETTESLQSPLIRKSPRLHDNSITENIETPQALIKKSPISNENCTTKQNIESSQSSLTGKSPRLNDSGTTKGSIESPRVTKLESPHSPLIRKGSIPDNKCVTKNVLNDETSNLEIISPPLKESELSNLPETLEEQSEDRDKVVSPLKTRYSLRRKITLTPVKQAVASPRRRRNSLSAVKDSEETEKVLASPVRSRSRRNSMSGCEAPLTPLRRSRRISGLPEVIAEEK